jgi:hypothetical protein
MIFYRLAEDLTEPRYSYVYHHTRFVTNIEEGLARSVFPGFEKCAMDNIENCLIKI